MRSFSPWPKIFGPRNGNTEHYFCCELVFRGCCTLALHGSCECTVRYRVGGKLLVVASIGRDLGNLREEVAMELGAYS